MTAGFRRSGDRIEYDFTGHEVALMHSLAVGLDETLSAAGDDDGDAVLDRLLPAAYGDDDAEASAEFAGYTRDRIAAAKRLRLRLLLEMLGADDEALARAQEVGVAVSLDADTAHSWLLALNDVRLALATRIGTDRLADPRLGPIGEVYDWLGWLQSGLLDALDR
jgi:hypothetical protein